MCANGLHFNDLVVHTEEGVGKDCSGSQFGRGMFLLGRSHEHIAIAVDDGGHTSS
jgi:hypothetical protein